jgi:hypothetical protein
MKKTVFVAGAAALVLLALTAGRARADHGYRFQFSFSGQNSYPAGALCDFNFQDTFTVTIAGTVLPNGDNPVVNITESVSHTNLDTGYSLTEVDHITNATLGGRGAAIYDAGIYWHLRDASGRTVLVRAGEVTFDANTGQLMSFTPNSGYDQSSAQIICPALGGSAA